MANYFNTEIISADSRQFFKEMQIGTAAPTKEELAEAPHHFIHHKSITENYNVGAFEKDALNTLNDLFQKKNIIILVGGSGLYVNAITKGLDYFPEVDTTIRLKLNQTFKNEGIETLQKQLNDLDPVAYQNIAIQNPHRLIRALEICIGTKQPYSSFLNKEKYKRPFKNLTIGLTANRDVIYNRINERVDIMIKNGLLEEVKSLLPYQKLNALNTVGYKELFKHLNGEWALDFSVSEIKKNSRRFAKRQLTWFKKNEDTIWFEYETKFEDLLKTLPPALT